MTTKPTKPATRELTRQPKRDALKTFGARLRYARVSMNLSQLEFARAVSKAANTQTSKSIVSQWESGGIKQPQLATMIAIASVTMFSQQWLLDGTGPERVRLNAGNGHQPNIDHLIRRAATIAAGTGGTPDAIGVATVQVFNALKDDPATPDVALKRIAQLATTRKK